MANLYHSKDAKSIFFCHSKYAQKRKKTPLTRFFSGGRGVKICKMLNVSGLIILEHVCLEWIVFTLNEQIVDFACDCYYIENQHVTFNSRGSSKG